MTRRNEYDMPDSMSFANEPNTMPQQGVPMQGWDQGQFGGQFPDPSFPQGMYPQDAMQAQGAMFGNPMDTGQMFPPFQDPMTGQQVFDPQAQFIQQGNMGYPNDPYMAGIPGYENAGMQFGGQPPMVPDMDYSQMMNGFPQGMPMQEPMQPMVQDPSLTGPGMAPVQQPIQQPNQEFAQPVPIQEETVFEQTVSEPAPAPAPVIQEAAPPLPPPKKGAARLSLVLGVFSIIFGLIPPIGIVLGLVSTSMAKRYINRGGRASAAESGRIFGRVGLVFSILFLLLLAFCVVYIAGATFANYGARALAIYYNNSPLGQMIGIFPMS